MNEIEVTRGGKRAAGAVEGWKCQARTRGKHIPEMTSEDEVNLGRTCTYMVIFALNSREWG